MIYRDYREGWDFGFVKKKEPDPRFLRWPLSRFLGHFVQLYFTCEECDSGEYMPMDRKTSAASIITAFNAAKAEFEVCSVLNTPEQ